MSPGPNTEAGAAGARLAPVRSLGASSVEWEPDEHVRGDDPGHNLCRPGSLAPVASPESADTLHYVGPPVEQLTEWAGFPVAKNDDLETL